MLQEAVTIGSGNRKPNDGNSYIGVGFADRFWEERDNTDWINIPGQNASPETDGYDRLIREDIDLILNAENESNGVINDHNLTGDRSTDILAFTIIGDKIGTITATRTAEQWQVGNASEAILGGVGNNRSLRVGVGINDLGLQVPAANDRGTEVQVFSRVTTANIPAEDAMPIFTTNWDAIDNLTSQATGGDERGDWSRETDFITGGQGNEQIWLYKGDNGNIWASTAGPGFLYFRTIGTQPHSFDSSIIDLNFDDFELKIGKSQAEKVWLRTNQTEGLGTYRLIVSQFSAETWQMEGGTNAPSMKQKEGWLIEASDWINRNFRFRGEKVTLNGRMEWPRKDVYLFNGECLKDDVIPWQVQEATALLADLFRQGFNFNSVSTDDVAVSKQKIDVIEVTYSTEHRIRGDDVPNAIHRILKPLLLPKRLLRT